MSSKGVTRVEPKLSYNSDDLSIDQDEFWWYFPGIYLDSEPEVDDFIESPIYESKSGEHKWVFRLYLRQHVIPFIRFPTIPTHPHNREISTTSMFIRLVDSEFESVDFRFGFELPFKEYDYEGPAPFQLQMEKIFVATLSVGQETGVVDFTHLIFTTDKYRRNNRLFVNSFEMRCKLVIDKQYSNESPIFRPISEDMSALYKSGQHSDVTLVVENREFRAHKCILSMRSNVFNAMFEHNFEEKKTNRVVIKDMSEEVFELILRYIYSDRIDETFIQNKCFDMIESADRFELIGLVNVCQNYLIKHIMDYDIKELSQWPERHSLTHLKKQIEKSFENKINESQYWIQGPAYRYI